MSHKITVEGGKSVRLPTAGKYCDRDIVVTAEGGTEDLNDVLTEQEALIDTLKQTLQGKASGVGGEGIELARSMADRSITEYTDSELTIVGDRAFSNCSKLTMVNVPNATSINGYAFDNCTALVSVDIPNAMNIGAYAFYYCSKLKNVNAPKVTKVLTYAFANCQALESISLPDVESVGNRAFEYSALAAVSLPKVTQIGVYAFASCQKLTSVDLPNVTTLPSSAFSNDTALTLVNIPNVTAINPYTFETCYSLTTIDLPKVTDISNYAFSRCGRLIAVILRSETLCLLQGTYAFDNCYHILGKRNSTYNPQGLKDGYIYVPKNLLEQYASATNWSTFSSQLRAIEDYPEICGGEA